MPLRSRQPVAPAPAAPKAEVAPTAKQAKSGLPFKDFPGRKLPYKDPPARPTEQPKVAAPVGPPKEGGRIIPPRPGRPAPVLPPPGSVKPPPPVVSIHLVKLGPHLVLSIGPLPLVLIPLHLVPIKRQLSARSLVKHPVLVWHHIAQADHCLHHLPHRTSHRGIGRNITFRNSVKLH